MASFHLFTHVLFDIFASLFCLVFLNVFGNLQLVAAHLPVLTELSLLSLFAVFLIPLLLNLLRSGLLDLVLHLLTGAFLLLKQLQGLLLSLFNLLVENFIFFVFHVTEHLGLSLDKFLASGLLLSELLLLPILLKLI